ncbi:MAG: hypothetical protein OEZ59_13020 [Deltaproteobacteria bacterium]|nr:hypothetical protein [Deltaproteobacteria bacterium]
MNLENHKSDYYQLARNPEFERRVSQAAEQAIMEMDEMVANEVKLRYVTHIFARTLDEVAKWLIKPDVIN